MARKPKAQEEPAGNPTMSQVPPTPEQGFVPPLVPPAGQPDPSTYGQPVQQQQFAPVPQQQPQFAQPVPQQQFAQEVPAPQPQQLAQSVQQQQVMPAQMPAQTMPTPAPVMMQQPAQNFNPVAMPTQNANPMAQYQQMAAMPPAGFGQSQSGFNPFGIDLTDVKDGFKLMEDGIEVEAIIKMAKTDVSTTGNNKISLDLEVVWPEHYKGVVVKDSCSMVETALWKWKSLCSAVGVWDQLNRRFLITEVSQLQGMRVRFKNEHRPDQTDPKKIYNGVGGGFLPAASA